MEQYQPEKFRLVTITTKKEQYMRPEASWRRMLTHQPPLYIVGKFSEQSGQFGTHWSQPKAPEQANGLQMESLFHCIASLLFGSECDISIYIGRNLAADVKHAYPAVIRMWSRETNDNWDRMVREFDLVLARNYSCFGGRLGSIPMTKKVVRRPKPSQSWSRFMGFARRCPRH